MVTAIRQSAQSTPDWVERERTRLSAYADAREFFDGDQWLGRPVRGETRMTFNYARALIKKVASYAFPSPTTFGAVAPSEAEGQPAEQILADYLNATGAHELDLALCIEASTIGDAAVKITWDPIALEPIIGQVDPATLAAWWDPTNPSRLYRIEQHYQLPPAAIATAAGMDVATLDPNRLYPIVERWTDQTWQLEITGVFTTEQPNPYGWIPYLVIPNERPLRSFWGTSDLADLYDVARAINKRMSTLDHVMELSGAPIAVLENVEGSDGIRVGPGAKWEIPEGSRAYLLDLLQGGGIRLHIENLQLLTRMLHDLSETPRTAFGDSGRTLSGAALEVEIQPLVQRVRRKRSAFGTFYVQRNARLLDLMERFGGQRVNGIRATRPVWAPILPSDEETAVRNQVSLVTAQISSRKRAAELLGNDDPAAELDQIVQEIELLAARSQPTADEGANRQSPPGFDNPGDTPKQDKPPETDD